MARSKISDLNTSTSREEPVEGPVLVAFDFDGTLTVTDSFMAFVKWRAGPVRYAIGMVRLFPAAISYLFHRNRGIIKAAAVRVFLKGVPRDRLQTDAKAFAQQAGREFFRQDAVATWRRWQGKGARLVIVTASPDLLVAPFARALGADTLIGTQLAFDEHDRISGAFAGANCRGAEKVRRLRETFGDDMRLAAAYGDTAGDHEMLRIADERGYQIFKG